MLNHLKGRVYDRVKKLLEDYPELRDNDQKLYLAYLNIYHGLKKSISPEAYEIIKGILLANNTPHFESVGRCRRKIQEAGMLVGTVQIEKRQEQLRVKDYYRSSK